MNLSRTVDWWLRYDASGASSRYRALQYFDPLLAEGWMSRARPLAPFGAARLRQAGGIAKRLGELIWAGSRGTTATVVQKELLMPPALGREWVVQRLAHRPLVWDIDDAIWELSAARERQARHLVEAADIVVAGSPVLADWCTRAGAKQVELVPTCTAVSPRPPTRSSDVVVIAWLGSATTALFLDDVADALLDVLSGPVPCRLEVMGGPLPERLRGHPSAIALKWSVEAEHALLSRAFVGIAPAPRTAYADGKCGFKVARYAAHGMAVVATDNPAHRCLLGDHATLVSTSAEWREALATLVADRSTCEEQGVANWSRAREKFSIEVGAAHWSKVLASVC